MWCNYEKWNEVREKKTFRMEYIETSDTETAGYGNYPSREVVEVSSLEWVKSGERKYY